MPADFLNPEVVSRPLPNHRSTSSNFTSLYQTDQTSVLWRLASGAFIQSGDLVRVGHHVMLTSFGLIVLMLLFIVPQTKVK